MYRIFTGLIFVIVAGTHQSALAAPSAAFGCDTAAGRFSLFELPMVGQHVRVSGIMASPLVRKDERWSPKGSMYLTGGGVGSGFSITRRPGSPWWLTLRVDGKESEPVASLSKFDPTPFVLDVNAATGGVDLTFAGTSYHAAGTPFQNQMLQVSCSTGEFDFTDLKWEILAD